MSDSRMVERVASKLRAAFCIAIETDGLDLPPEIEANWTYLARAALSALTTQGLVVEQGWRPIAEAKPEFGEVLGWAKGCGFEIVRRHSDGYYYAGAFNADWVTHLHPLPAPPLSSFSPPVDQVEG